MKLLHPSRHLVVRCLIPVAVVGVLLLISLVIDLVPRFQLGDSAEFLATRYGKLIPDNRSWTYGLAAGWVLRSTRQLVSLPLCQIVLSWIAFGLFAAAAARKTNSTLAWAIVIFLVGCLEPLGYYWSRSFMSDSPAQSVFVILCAILLFSVGPAWRFVLMLVFCLVLLSLRIIYFPALAVALALALAWRCAEIRAVATAKGASIPGPRKDPEVRAWCAALLALVAAYPCYAFANTSMTHARTFTADVGDMEFLVGSLSPLIRDELDKTPLTPRERAVLYPLNYDERVAQTFGPHGLVAMIRHHFRSRESARPVMKRLVLDAVRDHPLELAQLVLRQWSDYLDPALVIRSQYRGDLSGAVPAFPGDPRVVLPDYIIRAFAAWKLRPVPSRTAPSVRSPALWYLERVGGAWSLLLSYFATFGIFLLPLAWGRRGRGFFVFASGFSFFYMATLAFGANQMVTRYLLPLDAPLLYSLGWWLAGSNQATTAPSSEGGNSAEGRVPPAGAQV